MRIDHPVRTALPEGWFNPDRETAVSLHAELQRELPPGHVLTGREVETIAWREEETDDLLFRHMEDPDRFTVIHLSWRGCTEISPGFPAVVFDGTFSEFLAAEKRLYGLIDPEGI